MTGGPGPLQDPEQREQAMKAVRGFLMQSGAQSFKVIESSLTTQFGKALAGWAVRECVRREAIERVMSPKGRGVVVYRVPGAQAARAAQPNPEIDDAAEHAEWKAGRR